jgi:NADH-ubiquinone oxidoreductase chain 5
MLILVTGDNFLQLFVGWEGVGLCSYLLINFWFSRIQANKAAIKAMVLNRIGDFGLALGIFVIFSVFKSVDYATVFALAPFFIDSKFNFLNFDILVLDLICFLLFIGAMGKSAQLGLHTWLPDAMEGPTPVSALIHAATMVTAGVFLLTRNSILFEYSPLLLNFIALIGASTAFFAATIGLLQNDIKRIIAYSTCSQLGYMMFACGLSNYNVGVFHLVNHAFFKALLFLGAGSVIHGISDEQDIRKMGGLKNFLPFTYSMMLIGSFALIGFPFLTGFYSKDVILEIAYGKFTSLGVFSFFLGTIGAFFTAFYSTRLIYLTFLTKPNGYKRVILNSHDASFQISISLFLLAVPSIFFGFITKDMFIGLGTSYWKNSIFIVPSRMNIIDSEFINLKYKLLATVFSLLGVSMAYIFYTLNQKSLFFVKLSNTGRFIYNFLNKKWFFDKMYNELVAQKIFKTSYNISYKNIDKGFVEIFGPTGIALITLKTAKQMLNLQTTNLYQYALLMLLGVTVILILNVFCSFLEMKFLSIIMVFTLAYVLF